MPYLPEYCTETERKLLNDMCDKAAEFRTECVKNDLKEASFTYSPENMTVFEMKIEVTFKWLGAPSVQSRFP